MKGTMGSYMTFQLDWSIKLIEKTLLNKNTSGYIPSKRWHCMVLMLKMISTVRSYLYFTGTMHWSFTCCYCNFNCGSCCCCCYCSLWRVTRYIISKVKIIVTIAIRMISSTMGIDRNVTITIIVIINSTIINIISFFIIVVIMVI